MRVIVPEASLFKGCLPLRLYSGVSLFRWRALRRFPLTDNRNHF